MEEKKYIQEQIHIFLNSSIFVLFTLGFSGYVKYFPFNTDFIVDVSLYSSILLAVVSIVYKSGEFLHKGIGETSLWYWKYVYSFLLATSEPARKITIFVFSEFLPKYLFVLSFEPFLTTLTFAMVLFCCGTVFFILSSFIRAFPETTGTIIVSIFFMIIIFPFIAIFFRVFKPFFDFIHASIESTAFFIDSLQLMEYNLHPVSYSAVLFNILFVFYCFIALLTYEHGFRFGKNSELTELTLDYSF